MNQAAVETIASTRREDTAGPEAPTPETPPMARAWKHNLEAGAETLRAIQRHNAEFTCRMLDLQLQAANAFSADEPWESRVKRPLAIGASAIELYTEYVSRSFALAQRAMAPTWTPPAERH